MEEAHKMTKKIISAAYFKAAPTEYVYHLRNSKIIHEGKGQGFWCNARKDNILLIPMSEWDDPFAVIHRCKDNQDVSIDGKVLYQITTPIKFIENFNYSINPVTRERYTTDSERLVNRIIDLVSDSLRMQVREISLDDLLNEKEELGSAVKYDITQRVGEWGVACNGIYISRIAPTSPELIDALEAPYREQRLLAGEIEKLARSNKTAQERHKNRLEDLKRDKTEYEAKLLTLAAKEKSELATARISAETEKIRYSALAEVPAQVLFTDTLKRVAHITLTPDLFEAITGQGGNRR